MRITTLQDKTILITGAAGGMGEVEAEQLAACGAEVWIADIDEVGADRVARRLEATGGKAHPLSLDVTNKASWESAKTEISQRSGHLHGLVNNAGISFRKGMQDTELADWQRVLDVNLTSVFLGMQTMYPLLSRSAPASIVNVSSIAGMMGYFSPSYGASKWAVRGLSKAAALEYAAGNVRVNSIHPGLVDTPLLNSGSKDFVERSVEAVPMNRVGRPQEVADLVEFLLSDKSTYITGSELVVDGGLNSGGTYHQITAKLEDTRVVRTR